MSEYSPKQLESMAKAKGYPSYQAYLRAMKDQKYRSPRKKGSAQAEGSSGNFIKDIMSWHPKNTLEYVKKKMDSVWEDK
jgi:hypothetical protein